VQWLKEAEFQEDSRLVDGRELHQQKLAYIIATDSPNDRDLPQPMQHSGLAEVQSKF
jgi:hypothetical protein